MSLTPRSRRAARCAARAKGPRSGAPGRRALQRGKDINGGGGTPQGGFSRPSADSPSAPALQVARPTEDGRPHGAAPTVERDRPHNQDRSPHPPGLRPAPLPLLAFGHFPIPSVSLCSTSPYPFCPFGTFPPDRGNRPSPRGRQGDSPSKPSPLGEGAPEGGG